MTNINLLVWNISDLTATSIRVNREILDYYIQLGQWMTDKQRELGDSWSLYRDSIHNDLQYMEFGAKKLYRIHKRNPLAFKDPAEYVKLCRYAQILPPDKSIFTQPRHQESEK